MASKKRPTKPLDEEFLALQQLASRKGIKLNGTFGSTGTNKCLDCGTCLQSGKWYSEDVVNNEESMIKYWLNTVNDFTPVSYSWPSADRKYLCPKCFDIREEARLKHTASREAALQAAASSGIKLDQNPGPYFPGQCRRRCLYCQDNLSTQGWYYSSLQSRNGVAMYACYDVGQTMGSLIPVAYKVKAAVDDTYVCRNCYMACDGDIEM